MSRTFTESRSNLMPVDGLEVVPPICRYGQRRGGLPKPGESIKMGVVFRNMSPVGDTINEKLLDTLQQLSPNPLQTGYLG